MSDTEVKILWVSITDTILEYLNRIDALAEKRLNCKDEKVRAIYDKLFIHLKKIFDDYLVKIDNTINESEE